MIILDNIPPVIAVDPGSPTSAAVAFLDGMTGLRIYRGFDTLLDIAKGCRDAAAIIYPPARMVIEFVHSMPGQGVCSVFSFGRGAGVAFGALMATHPDWPLYEVTPQAWQNWYRNFIDIPKTAGSFDSREVAPQVLTPEMLEQCKKKRGSLDHNACDAALIAVWCANQPEEDLKVSEHWAGAPAKPKRVGRKLRIEEAAGLVGRSPEGQ